MTIYLREALRANLRGSFRLSIFSQLADYAVAPDQDIRDTANSYTSHTLRATKRQEAVGLIKPVSFSRLCSMGTPGLRR